jgi:tetratricopeptide (TPR) repeat protein
MTTITDLHRHAMALADEADTARRTGADETAHSLYEQAFALEQQAAELLRADLDAEPSRSILFRSAASLAMQCGEYREAERLIATALSGNPPDDVCQELRQLLKGLYATIQVAS